jgi:hypothetical protein
MQTIIGQFASPQDMDAAVRELRAYHVGPTQAEARPRHGLLRWFWHGGLTWDLVAQMTIIAGIVVGAFFGLLAGFGVFGLLGGPFTVFSVLAGLFVGISIGMIAGATIGSFAGAFLPNPVRFLPHRVSDQSLLVAVQTDDRHAHVAREVMQHAHATEVEAIAGRVPIEAFVPEDPHQHAA